jgi:hypothetical protein
MCLVPASWLRREANYLYLLDRRWGKEVFLGDGAENAKDHTSNRKYAAHPVFGYSLFSSIFTVFLALLSFDLQLPLKAVTLFTHLAFVS